MNGPAYHRLLQRQLDRYLDGTGIEASKLSPLLGAISEAYHSADMDRQLLERSMELSSKELLENNHELRAANLAAEAANMAKSDFLATMSHELRTPLNGILGMNSLLMETDLTREQLDFSTTIAASANSLLAILNDVLDFSKIEAGALTVEAIDCSLPDVVGEVVDTLSPLADCKGLEFCYLIRNRVPKQVMVDPLRLRQILLNLLGNAIKFTHKGEVSLAVSVQGRETSSPELHFRVSDTGIGIQPDRIKELFAPFVQADSTTTRRFGGTGLGLSISKRLVEAMGGELGVESEENVGSTFWFHIPLLSAADRSSDQEVVRLLEAKRVLIVDDNATNRKFLRHVVEGWGGIAQEANSGAEAIMQITADPGAFDLVYLDYAMPDIDGEEVFQWIQSQPGARDIPVLLLTSISDTGLATRMLNEGLSAYITKPIKPGRLFQETRTVLRQCAANQPAASPVAKQNTASQTILIVDDNATNRKVLHCLLERMGFTTATAQDGMESLEFLGESDCGLVLMDLRMPGMDGIEATTRIRTQLGLDVPIVGVTAGMGKGEEERFRKAGATEFLFKPIQSADLTECIQRYVRQRSMDGCDPSPMDDLRRSMLE